MNKQDIQDYNDMMEQLSQIAKFIKEEMRYRQKTELDQYIREVLK